MHLIETYTGERMIEAAGRKMPTGPKFSSDLCEHAQKMELWGSSFSDSGPDFCEFKLFGDGDQIIATRVIPGY